MIEQNEKPHAGDVDVRAKVEAGNGIPQLDRLLADMTSQGGGVILVGGGTGSGKTILAAQIAASFLRSSQRVALLSTEVPREELEARTLSAEAVWDYGLLVDGRLFVDDMGDFRVPYDSSRSVEFSSRALQFYRQMERCLEFWERRDFRAHPLDVLEDTLEGTSIYSRAADFQSVMERGLLPNRCHGQAQEIHQIR